jgi:hypothetical protein
MAQLIEDEEVATQQTLGPLAGTVRSLFLLKLGSGLPRSDRRWA